MQTPRTAGEASAVAESAGLQLRARRDYCLPDGAARVLLTFARTDDRKS